MSRRWLAIIALLATAGAWGATFTLIKHILTKIAPEPFMFWRFTLAGVILCAYAAWRRSLPRGVIRPGLILGILLFTGYWAQTRGLMTISPSRSAFLTGLFVVLVPFADRIVYGTRVSAKAWIGTVLAAIGTAALIGGFEARVSWGDVLTIFCAGVFALHVVFSAKWSAIHPTTGLAGIQVLAAGLFAMPPTLAGPPTPMSTEVVVVIVLTAVVTTAIAFGALMWGQAHVTATEAAVILSFEPVAASITSILWDKEKITAGFLTGAALILAAMILSQAKSKSEN